MKKTALFLTLTLLFSCLLPLAIHAEEQPRTLLEVLAEKSGDEREIFRDTAAYMEGMNAEWVDDEPLVTVYGFAFWHDPYITTFEEKLEYAKSPDLWPETIIENCVSFGDTVKLIEKISPKTGKEHKVSFVPQSTERGRVCIFRAT